MSFLFQFCLSLGHRGVESFGGLWHRVKINACLPLWSLPFQHRLEDGKILLMKILKHPHFVLMVSCNIPM